MHGLKKYLLQQFRHHLSGKKRLQKSFNLVRNLAQQGLNYGNGGNIDISGEITLMKYLSGKYNEARTYIIFDAGANQGDYCSALLDNISVKDLQVWCFEPSAVTFKKLQVNHSSKPNVFLINTGLGDKKSNLPLYTDQPGSVIASVFALERAFGTKQKLSDFEMVEIETIDGFMEDHNIPYVDLLKLDIEGNELNALFGAENMIKIGKIKAIQFEFGICNIDSRTYFRDFWNLLSPRYNIYRLLKDDLYPVTYYSEYDEVFATINYYAELK